MGKRTVYLIVAIFAFLICGTPLKAKTYYDTKKGDIVKLITRRNSTYDIRYSHVFTDTLYVPDGCVLRFRGGSLNGPIVFRQTLLNGDVKLVGSSISGRLKNKYFDASWICHRDGKTDDAKSINEMIAVCDSLVFPAGEYRLMSKHTPAASFPKNLHSMVNFHIGIGRSDVHLMGLPGCVFLTEDANGSLCVYSQPNNIAGSIRNISVRGIKFVVKNDGANFHEFLHTVKTCGVNGFTIENCEFDDFWGDAVCLSHYGDTPSTGERTRNSKVIIRNNKIIGGSHHSNRNGISIVSGEDVLVEGNVIVNTSRRDMPGAIDVEPNNTAYTINRITIRNNTIRDCKGTAGGICIHSTKGGGPAHNVKIEGNHITNCTIGIALVAYVDYAASNIQVTGNVVDGTGVPFRFYGKAKTRGWVFKDNVFKTSTKEKIGGSLKIEGFTVSGNKIGE